MSNLQAIRFGANLRYEYCIILSIIVFKQRIFMPKHISLLGLCLFMSFSLPAMAGQIYRYATPNGGTVVSRTLPPEISQKGYDILNDKTMRLIRRVKPALTDEQLAALEEEKKQQAIIEEEKKRQVAQRIEDRRMMANYHSVENLERDRDDELSKRREELAASQEKQAEISDNLYRSQEMAANQELAGQPLSKSLTENLSILQDNLSRNQAIIDRQQEELDARSLWYKGRVERFKALKGNAA